MVINTTTRNIIRQLERYFFKLTNFKLKGESYDLILLLPADSSYTIKYTWILSSKHFDKFGTRDIINDLLSEFKRNLSVDDYNTVARISIIPSGSPFVKNLNFMFRYPNEATEISNMKIGGEFIEHGIVLRSQILEKVKSQQIVNILTNQNFRFKAKIISMDNKFRIKYLTERGIDSPLNQKYPYKTSNMNIYDESDDISNGLISFIAFNQILGVE